MAFHVNPATGEAGQCGATKGQCPFGGELDHYATKEDARQAYEVVQGGSFHGLPELDNETRAAFKPANASMPSDAIATKDLKVGMKYRRPFEGDTVYTLLEPIGPSGLVVTDQGTYRLGQHWQAGTVRLVDGPEGYDYHKPKKNLVLFAKQRWEALEAMNPLQRHKEMSEDEKATYSKFSAQRDIAIEQGRKIARSAYRNQLGGRTYAISFGTERDAPDGDQWKTHILEADAPYGEREQAEFDAWINKNGFTYEQRKTRVSVFASFGKPSDALMRVFGGELED